MLTDTAIRNAKPREKPHKLADAGGLYLLVTVKGGKWWRYDYRHGGKRKTLSMGVYPEVGLKDARERLAEARKLLRDGIDPGAARKARKTLQAGRSENSFEAVAREWQARNAATWAPSHAEKILRRLERDIFPWIGGRAVGEITAPELLGVLRRIEERGVIETAHRAQQNCGQVFRYAIATGRAERDPSADLRGALTPWRQTHYPTMTDPKALGQLLRDMDAHPGGPIVRAALRLLPMVFVRPGELQRAEWQEVDLERAEWRIPPERMKARALHIVPLSRQALGVLKDLQPLTGGGRYVFPGLRTLREPISNNTLNAALRRMGYSKDQITAHSFRGIASTLLNEHGWHRDAIERQLAHAERDSVRAAYNHAEHLAERRKMMQWWADHLDALKTPA